MGCKCCLSCCGKFPDLRTVVLTSVLDEQFRSRVSDWGVTCSGRSRSLRGDQQFLMSWSHCSSHENKRVFRGGQSRAWLTHPLECLSQNSTVFKYNSTAGRIWIPTGVIHPCNEESNSRGEAGFTASCPESCKLRTLPAEPNQIQTILIPISLLTRNGAGHRTRRKTSGQSRQATRVRRGQAR